MHEHLKRHVGGAGDLLDVRNRQLARHDDPTDPEPADKLDAARLGEGHLRAAVHFERGCEMSRELRDPQVLDDDRIDSGAGDLCKVVGGVGQFAGEDERVERDESAHVVPMQIRHDFRQLIEPEVLRAMAGVVSVEPEVDRIRAVRDGGAHGIEVPGGAEQFGRG